MRQATVANRMSGRYGNRYGARSALQRAPGMPRETGYVDVTGGTYNLDTTGSVTLLNTVAQGASVNQRVGKKVALKSLQIRGHARNNSTATDNDVAYLIVYDKRPRGALPTMTDFFNTAASSSMNNDDNSGRFSILKRVDFTLIGSAANQYTSVSAVSSDFFLDLKGLPTVYESAGTGAIGDIEQGALYLVTIGQVAAGTAAAALTGTFRLRYFDVNG